MAAKKKTRKKQTRKTSSGKIAKKKVATKKATVKKRLPKKKSVQKKAAVKTKAVSKTTRGAKKAAPAKQTREKNDALDQARFSSADVDSGSGGQAGDLQGLSNIESADSESVDELVEEGNAFEADAVAGVEEADNSDEREVHTHEVPEDDVPEEYLDEE